jgi:hypothetical protein
LKSLLGQSAAAGVPTTGGAETPADSSTSGEADADTTTVMEDGGNGATTTPATDEEATGARGDMGDAQAPGGSSAPEETTDAQTATTQGEVEAVPSSTPEPANDNTPVVDFLATGTE